MNMVNNLADSQEPTAISKDSATPAGRLRILSLSCVYPNPIEPVLGPFVRWRLQHLSALADIMVVAPIAAIRYGGGPGGRFGRRKIPLRRSDGATEVLHPMWIYPPGGTWINAVCLFLRLLPATRALRTGFRFDVIDAHFGYPEGVAAAMLSAATGVPFAITLRGNETMHAQGRVRGWIMKWAMRRAERVVTVSGRLRQFALSSGVDAQRVSVIPNGIDSGVFYPRDRRACRAKLGIGPGARVILSAGSLIERKGHHRILEAISTLNCPESSCQVVVAGGSGQEGDFEDRIRQLIRTLGLEGLVRLEGQVSPERMAELMSAADVLCLASTREGWPNVVHEALACGLPVIATDVGAVPEMIPSAEYGIVIPPNNPEALRQALLRALEKSWGRAGISAWAQSRSWDAVAGEVFAQLQKVVIEGKKRGGA